MRRKRLKSAIANLNRVTEIITLNDEIRQSIQNMLLETSADTVKGLFRLAFSGNPNNYIIYDFSEVDCYIDMMDYIKQIKENKKER